VGGVRFWERREVKDLLAYLRFLFNPADTVSFARIVNVPRRKVGPVTVDKVIAHARAKETTPLAVLAAPEEITGVGKAAIAPLLRFRDQLESLRATLGVLKPGELVEHVVEVMGLEPYYDDGTPQGEARTENLREVRGLAEEFDTNADPLAGLEAFLTEVALVSDVDSYSEDDDGVTLITLHMVKGLEFPVVFIAGLEEGLLPHQRALDDPSGKEMEEERRLAYVGITRAQPAKGAAPAPPPRPGSGGPTYRERILERQVADAPARPVVQRFKEGDLVSHPSFGPGTIMKSTLTRSDEELVVKFDRTGVKILSGTLAPLERR
jgi:DNA helicase-2/ATP-dependent DNA helicase PcrA